MATLRQYFETDFNNCLKVKVKIELGEATQDAVLMYDFNGFMAYLSIYLEGKTLGLDLFNNLIGALEHGKTQMPLSDGVILPSAKTFHGKIQISNVGPFEIKAKFFGDPEWLSSNTITATTRLFLYSETNLPHREILKLKALAKERGHNLQFRSTAYQKRRSEMEKPVAFICHDSRDKDEVARKIATGLQKMLCTVWYDEYSLKIGDNLRNSIEKGIKECKKCILVISPNFIGNEGWAKKEFNSIFTREILEEQELILPVWVNVTKEQVYDYSPSLLNVRGTEWDELGEDEVCRQLNIAVSQ